MNGVPTLWRNLRPFSASFRALFLASVFWLMPAGQASSALVTWSFSTLPGVTLASQSGADTSYIYFLQPAGGSVQEWFTIATAPAAGEYTFDWSYSGFHGFSFVTAYLFAFWQPPTGFSFLVSDSILCCDPPAGGFAYSGSFTFPALNAGDFFGFGFGGVNLDNSPPVSIAENVLTGTLLLHQVSEPGTLALLGTMFAGLVGLRRWRGPPPQALLPGPMPGRMTA